MIIKINNQQRIVGEGHIQAMFGKAGAVLSTEEPFFRWAKQEEIAISVSLLLTSPRKIKRLNKRFRNIKRPTDVLSFPSLESDGEIIKELDISDRSFLLPLEEGGHVLELGDIVISVKTALKQAKEIGNSLDEELVFLFIHSILHLLGYDHLKSKDESLMLARQREIIARIKENNV